jgi:hypothetical protein
VRGVSTLIQPFQGWGLDDLTQGRRWRANPGLYDRNPFSVARRTECDGYHEEWVRPEADPPDTLGMTGIKKVEGGDRRS